jgi:hypothetical protein
MVEDPNDNPFELFKKEDHEQFGLEIQEVTVDNAREGIGVWEEIIDETAQAGSRFSAGSTLNREWIIIDPMTKETISKEQVLNEDGEPVLHFGQPQYKVNDHWFVLNAKFVWRDAPEPPKPETPQFGQFGGMMPRRPPTSPSSGSSGNSLTDIE